MPNKSINLFRVTPKGISVKLRAVCGNNVFCVLDQAGPQANKSALNSVIPSGGEVFIALTDREVSEDFETHLEVHDYSISPEVLIGELKLKISKGAFAAYHWVPVSAGYLAHLADFLYPPATLVLLKVPVSITSTDTEF
jgi:hypothetical protein